MAANSSDGATGMAPDDVGRKTFTMVRKGFDPIEVQGFLVAVASELRQARADLLQLDGELRTARQEADRNRELDPARLTTLLGEETARVIEAARLAADDMRAHAETASNETMGRANAEAARIRDEAASILQRRTAEAEAAVEVIRQQGDELRAQAQADAAAEVEKGRQQGREMVGEAQKVRERMLNDLARRRKLFRQQIERLQAGRDRLMSAYEVVRETLDAATEELQVALPEARLAAEAAALRAGEEDEPTFDELEQEAAGLPAPPVRPEPEPADEPEPAVAEVEEPEPADDEPEAVEDDRPRAPSDATVEGRRSSSVNVIRGDDTGPQPVVVAEAVAETPPPAAPEADEPESASAEATEVAAPDSAAPESAPPEAEVSSLFARIREEVVVETVEVVEDDQGHVVEVVETVEDIEIVEEIVVDEAELAELSALAAAPGEEAEQEEPAPPLDADHQLLARRDEGLAEVERSLSRRIKRELSDEQNELLDTVRRQKGTPSAENALPALDAHRARYRSAVLPSLVVAASVGADLVADLPEAGPKGAGATKTGDLATELAAELVDPLRERLERCFGETVGDNDELAERVRACYREWKGQRVDELVVRHSLAAANQGLLERLPEGTLVHWVVDDGSTPSPDCDDNALAGDIPKGDAFPTGHTAPPISSTCRCLVAPKPA